MIFAKSGTWLLDTARNEKPVRFQIYPTMFMRISHTDLFKDGYTNPDPAEGRDTEFVPLATALLEHLRMIHSRIDALSDAIKSHGDSINALSAHTHTVPAGTDASGGTSGGSAVVIGEDPTIALEYPLDFSDNLPLQPDDSAADYDGGSDELKAGIFRISSLSYGEQQDL
jgi:hypothetical protein